MYQDPIHIEHTHLVDEVNRWEARETKLWRELQAHLREHCFRGAAYDFRLEEEWFEARKRCVDVRQELFALACAESIYIHNF